MFRHLRSSGCAGWAGGLAGMVLAPAVLLACDDPITPSANWKNALEFPDDPFVVQTFSNQPRWVKFTILICEGGAVDDEVYFQNSVVYALHYDFATNELDPFIGMGPSEYDAITLYENNQQAILGAVLMPPMIGLPQSVIPEYGVQFVRQDAYDPQTIVELFSLVRSKINAGPEVSALYFPTFEQLAVAEQNSDWLASQGVVVSSPDRWLESNSCYSHGWALGQLKYFPADQIDDVFVSGDLQPDDILLTDAVPAEIPPLAGIISLSASTPNSHVAILANTFSVPFVHVMLPEDVAHAQALVDHRVVLRADRLFDACNVHVIDIEGVLSESQIAEILDLKTPAPLEISAIEPYGAVAAPTDDLQVDDIRYFGGKAAHFGLLRRAIPLNSPVSLALSFDLWTAFMSQELAGGQTLAEHIAGQLAGTTYPPDMASLSETLEGIRALIKDDTQTAFSPALQTAVLAALQDPQYAFDADRRLRFRSSTNVEDSARFSGAGLYDSKSGCLADELDGDDVGPSLCELDEPDERGVFRAIRRVFASFYNQNAYLERLRYGVDEADVGMAVLVHHSFPDPIELANGVATFERGPSPSRDVVLVSQPGAVSVTNPEPGLIPEVVNVFVSSWGTNYPTLMTYSNLLPIGVTVMDFPDEYDALTQLLSAVSEEYELASGQTQYVLDFEYKRVAPDGALVVKQVRPLPQPDDEPSITPFLLNDPTEYCVFQGETGDVFSNHRLKSRWQVRTDSLWLTAEALQQSFYADVEVDFVEGCGQLHFGGRPSGWPDAAYSFAGGDAVDSWTFTDLQIPRTYQMMTQNIPELVAPSESPVLVVTDFGPSCLPLTVNYPVALPGWDWTGPIMTTSQFVLLCECPRPRLGDIPQQRMMSDGDITIETSFVWPPDPGFAAGYTAPLVRFDETVISGLTTQPIVLHSEYAQTYRPEHHNFSEHFMFEPALDPLVTAQQRAELAAAGVRVIHALYGYDESMITWYDDEAWGDVCDGCTGIAVCADVDPADGIRDDNCVAWQCEGGVCVGTEVVYADMGGANGACLPDGTADGNDRFHALNCFSNKTTLGGAGYPCETNPPSSYNVDFAGLGTPCNPDGVCDGNDAFAALNAFSGTTSCSCAAAARPVTPSEPAVVGTASMQLLPSAARTVPGATVEVDAFLIGPLRDLRGYQLHVRAQGGRSGRLDLVDLGIEERKDHVFAELPDWRGFNLDTAQLLAGLDSHGVATRGKAYLATLTFKVSADADGTFVIDLLADYTDPTQRTFLLPTAPDARIHIRAIEPALIDVVAGKGH